MQQGKVGDSWRQKGHREAKNMTKNWCLRMWQERRWEACASQTRWSNEKDRVTSETTAVTAVKKRTESGSNYSLTRSRKTTKKVKLHSVVNTMLLLQKKSVWSKAAHFISLWEQKHLSCHTFATHNHNMNNKQKAWLTLNNKKSFF